MEMETNVESILKDLDQRGWSVMPNYLDSADSLRLRHECQIAYENGEFRRAGVGRGKELKIREDIRQDHVMWLKSDEFSPELSSYLSNLEALRKAINQRFFLGLFEYEGHFAIYPEGAFYKMHLDRHVGTADRIVTMILYLNEHWQPGDGGELKIWTTPGAPDGPYECVEPRMGTLVCFLSGDFWHEVLAASKTRMSITGWFRQQSA